MTKIMVVDDAPFMRAVLKNILEKAGYEVVEAGSGNEAVSIYPTEKPDIVTMDIVMPGMDGIESSRKILEQDPSARIIMVTALDSRDSLKEAIKIGIEDFIVKPFKTEEVLDSIGRALKEV